MNNLKLKDNIYWVGALDPDLKVFDIIMETEFGTTYNSYLVKGSEKTVLFETVKVKYYDDYIKRLSELTDLKDIDYIVVNHTEPDHAGSIEKILKLAARAKIVGSEQAIDFLKEIANRPFESITVKHGDTIDLGNKTLKFISAPFLHWPDSIYTYIPEDKMLFTCDSFGSHYSFDGILYSAIPNDKIKDYKSALLYYYTAIFGPFKDFVIQALDKIKDLDIDMLCVGHGPVIDKDIPDLLDTYRKWSTPDVTNDKTLVVIPHVSAYGYTADICSQIIKGITEKSDIEVKAYNINISNYNSLKNEIMEDISHAKGVLFGTSTINGDALPPIWDLAVSLSPIVHKGKIVSAFGSYGWSGEAVGNITDRLKQLRMQVAPSFRVRFKPSEKDLSAALDYGRAFAEYIRKNAVPSLNAGSEEYEAAAFNSDGSVKKWRCTVCGEIFEGVMPPKTCPACGVGQDMFEEYISTGGGFSNDTSDVFVIIGSGAAGVSAAEAIRKRNKKGIIKIITSDKQYPYYRPVISDYLCASVPDSELFIKNKSWYEQNSIEVLTSKTVEEINTDSKLLIMGEEIQKYDKLIIAAGARAHFIPFPGGDKKGIFTIRTLDDADKIKEYIKLNKCRNAFFIGGGVLGLEAASSFREIGLNVSVIEREERIFPRQLDIEGSAILEKKMDKLGIRVFKKAGVKRIDGEDTVTGIELDDERYFTADIIVISAGIRANKILAEKAGIKNTVGIVVNERMETSLKDIYACGDCAEFQGKIQGLWASALLQGETAGANASGDSLVYKEEIQPVTFAGMETPIFSVGDIGHDSSKKYSVVSFTDEDSGIYKKLYFHQSILQGGILIGDVSSAASILKGVKESAGLNNFLNKCIM